MKEICIISMNYKSFYLMINCNLSLRVTSWIVFCHPCKSNLLCSAHFSFAIRMNYLSSSWLLFLKHRGTCLQSVFIYYIYDIVSILWLYSCIIFWFPTLENCDKYLLVYNSSSSDLFDIWIRFFCIILHCNTCYLLKFLHIRLLLFVNILIVELIKLFIISPVFDYTMKFIFHDWIPCFWEGKLTAVWIDGFPPIYDHIL